MDSASGRPYEAELAELSVKCSEPGAKVSLNGADLFTAPGNWKGLVRAGKNTIVASAKGFQTVWFGVLPLPDLLAKDKALGNLLETVHVALNFTLIAVLLGHVGAALKHHFIDRDDVLTRMLPRRRG